MSQSQSHPRNLQPKPQLTLLLSKTANSKTFGGKNNGTCTSWSPSVDQASPTSVSQPISIEGPASTIRGVKVAKVLGLGSPPSTAPGRWFATLLGSTWPASGLASSSLSQLCPNLSILAPAEKFWHWSTAYLTRTSFGTSLKSTLFQRVIIKYKWFRITGIFLTPLMEQKTLRSISLTSQISKLMRKRKHLLIGKSSSLKNVKIASKWNLFWKKLPQKKRSLKSTSNSKAK